MGRQEEEEKGANEKAPEKNTKYIYNKILAAVGVENEMKVRLLHAVAVSSWQGNP